MSGPLGAAAGLVVVGLYGLATGEPFFERETHSRGASDAALDREIEAELEKGAQNESE